MNKKYVFCFGLLILISYCTQSLCFQYASRSDILNLYQQESLGQLNQNNNQKFFDLDFFNVGGKINFDVKPKTMQKSMPGEGEDYFALSNMLISYNGNIKDLISLNTSLAYYKNNKGQGDYKDNAGLFLDEAYITLSKFDSYPFFAQFGKIYLPFGQYDRLVVSPSLVQMLTMARANTMHFGFINHFMDTVGVTTSFYFSQGTLTRDPQKIQGDINGGAAGFIKYKMNSSAAFNVGIQYIYNMLNVNALRQGGVYQLASHDPQANVYKDRTDGLSSQVSLNIFCFDVFFNYVTALQSSKNLVLYRQNPVTPNTSVAGAKPSAWEIGAKSNAIFINIPTSFDVMFQKSYETAGLFVFNALPNNTHPFPEIRYILGMNLFFYKNTYLRIQWGHNFLYKQHYGDTGRQGDDATIRLGLFT